MQRDFNEKLLHLFYIGMLTFRSRMSLI